MWAIRKRRKDKKDKKEEERSSRRVSNSLSPKRVMETRQRQESLVHDLGEGQCYRFMQCHITPERADSGKKEGNQLL